MKLPWRKDPGSEESGDSEAEAEGKQGSEREQRERLRKERRERGTKARSDLAAKANDEPPRSESEAAKRESRKPKSPSEPEAKKREATKPKVAKSKPAKANGEPATGTTGARSERQSKEPEAKSRRGAGRSALKRKREATESKRPTSRRQRLGKLRGELGSTIEQGARETRDRARKAAPRLAKGTLAVLGIVFGAFFAGLTIAMRLGIGFVRFLSGPVRGALLRFRRLLDALSGLLTPVRMLGLVVAGGIVLLALSQYADYRTVTIGNDAYADGIQTVAPAPEVDRAATGSAHSYLFVPIAVLCVPVLLLALRGRWRLCRLIAIAGVAAIVVGLIVDRPAGLDIGDRGLAYGGVEASLIGGFYAQLSAGLLLVASSLLLGRELRLAGAAKTARASSGSRAPRLPRRGPRVEGARA